MDSDTRLSLASLTATRLAFGLQQVCIARCLFRYAAGLGGRIWFLSIIDFSLLHLHHPSHERVSSSPSLLTTYHVQHTACHDFTQYTPTHIELLEAVTTVTSVAWCQRHAARLCSHPWMEPFKHLRKPPLTSKPHHLITSSLTGNAEANTSGCICLLILASASLLESLLHHRFVTVVKLHAQSMTLSLFTPLLLFTSLRHPNSGLSHSSPPSALRTC